MQRSDSLLHRIWTGVRRRGGQTINCRVPRTSTSFLMRFCNLYIYIYIYIYIYTYTSHEATEPNRLGPPHCRGFKIALKHTTLCRTPLDEWFARRRDLYLTTHSTRKRHTSLPSAGFETAFPVSKRPQTHAFDRAATGFGLIYIYIQGVPGEMDKTSGECSLCWTIPM